MAGGELPSAISHQLSARRRRWLRGIPIQLLLWTTVPAMLVLVALAVVGVVGHQQAMRELVLARDARLAQTAAERLTDRLEMQVGQLAVLADEIESPISPPVQDTVPALLAAHTALSKTFDQGVALVSPDGRTLATLPQNLNRAQLQPAIRSLLSDTAQFSTRVSSVTSTGLSTSLDDPASGERLLLMAAPVGENWLVGGVSLRHLGVDQLVAALSLGVEGRAYVIDGAGRVLVASEAGATVESLRGQPGVDAVLRGEAGAIIAPVEGAAMVVGYAPIPLVGWALITQEPWAAIVGPMMRFSLVVPLILVVAAVAALITIIFGLRSIVRPLQQLDRQAALLAWGDFEAVQTPVGGTQEIEDLRRTLHDLARQIRAYQQGMRDYIGAITRGQEEERKRLARELHDDTVQDLIALGHRVQMAQRALEHDPGTAAERLDELKDLINETLAEVRRFTRALRPIYLEDLGLLPALEMLVRDVESKTGIATEFQVLGPSRRLPEELELAVFRIAQETLTNIVQHAQASRAAAHLRFTDGEVTLTVTDDGVGFAVPERPEGLARAGHFGLVGMQERAALVGGRLVLESEAGRGTKVTARLPVPELPLDSIVSGQH
ncbi:MAG: histidine kinase [Anaerolineae bacterium]